MAKVTVSKSTDERVWNIKKTIVEVWYSAPNLYHLREEALADVDALVAECDRYRDALRYILGHDVAGYDAHIRPEEVAHAALNPEETP